MNTISIIGAGIGGLTLGNVLKQNGYDFTIYESAPEIKPVGAGIMMAVNAMQVFDKLGLKEKIENAGNKIHRIILSNESLKPFSKTEILELEQQYNSCNVAIHRAELQRILAENLNTDSIQLNHSLGKIEKKENYILDFENGNQIESTTVFGADGIKSPVRNQIFKTGTIRNAGQKCWRGLVDFELPEEHHHEAFEMWGKGKRFGFIKISEKKVYWYACINEKSFSRYSGIADIFRDFDHLVLKLIEATPEKNIICNEISDLTPIPLWYAENLCLIGDAAHATTPNMGQGACQAIEDAYVIGRLLEKSRDFNAIFEEFQKIRRKKVDYIVNTSRSIGKISQWEYGNSLRNFMMSLIPENINQKMAKKIIELDI
ncbi:FAD-dependent monooxygenase [Chryseobacterium sp. BIGb0232]|uniref:FAD-dependent monooxygenase n=1 Tax=Chryseobacterium sp. BIGb0232 TaxID=2940598 RepID=UPI000F46CEE4|nr:FAD-dependent monooxygenase [Chryseobacterium sp. BIGb0232]MCS4305599.1 2-polyprenyl-6-methoxyphenol hydroxylase-like FAD-dependent oxidoreductase [Chryseobacterium sp. BIGb0232]ROS20789.1 2-polyprenyl-6-methoxyphenol hydroxylase-like FAD-dependent oxidoreductase [Chryseobacterium nakagawai]